MVGAEGGNQESSWKAGCPVIQVRDCGSQQGDGNGHREKGMDSGYSQR